MTQSISGLGSGLDTNAIIQQLVALERNSQNLMKSRATRANVALATMSGIREQLVALRSAAAGLSRFPDWRPLFASSSNTDAVTVSGGSGTFGGSLTFTVDSRASAGSFRSVNTLSGTGATVAADAAVMVAAKGATIGFASFASDDDLTVGAHEIRVTQASSAATKHGGSALAASTVITGANNTIQLTVNGDTKTLTIADGTYDRTQLAAAIRSAAEAEGAAVAVSVDQVQHTLTIATAREGTQATIQVTGGTALATLQLSTDGGAITGTDGKVQVGNAPEQTISLVEAGAGVVLDAAVGTVTAQFSGGLREGSVTAKNVAVGDGSLAAVVANINAANAGVTATAVLVGDNTYRLQIGSTSTGALNGPNVAASELHANVGGLVTLTEAADARITVGSGPGAYEVTSASNSISGLLPGVTATLKATTTGPVTITVQRDTGAIVEKVQALVDAANRVKKAIAAATAYNAETKQASPLTGDATVRRVVAELHRAINDAVPWAAPASPGLAGLGTDKEGLFTFDASKFAAAFDADPEGMTRLFTQGGTATDGNVSFVSAGDRAHAGTYAVDVTVAAAPASAVGLDGAWPIGAPPTIRVRVGATEATYEVQSGDLRDDVVTGLNAAFAAAGLALEAVPSGGGVAVRTTSYGSSARFDVAWDGATWESHTGTDVEGTIGGVAASGNGRLLTVPFDHPGLGGLALEITATVPGSLGELTYRPGVAQRVASTVLDATDFVTGYITSREGSMKSRVSFIEKQVESMERRLVLFEARLRRQFAALDSTLGVLQQRSNWLAGQIAGLTQNTGK